METIKELNRVINSYPSKLRLSLKGSIIHIWRNKNVRFEETIKEVDELNKFWNVKTSISNADIEKINIHGFIDELIVDEANEGPQVTLDKNSEKYKKMRGVEENHEIIKRQQEVLERTMKQQEIYDRIKNQRENSLKSILQKNSNYKKSTNNIIQSLPNRRVYIDKLTKHEELLKNKYTEVTKTFNATIKDILGESFDLLDVSKGKRFIQVISNQIIDVVQKRYTNPKIFKLIKQWDEVRFQKLIEEEGLLTKSLADDIAAEVKFSSQEKIFAEESDILIRNHKNVSKRASKFLQEHIFIKKIYRSPKINPISPKVLWKPKPKLKFKLKPTQVILKTIRKAIS